MSWYGNVSLRQRRTYTILIGIIALTVPCYCIGLGALTLAPGIRVSRSPTLAPPPNTPVIVAVTLPPYATLQADGNPHTVANAGADPYHRTNGHSPAGCFYLAHCQTW